MGLNLLKYFISRDEDLPASYVRNCEKFLKKIKKKVSAQARKRSSAQAPGGVGPLVDKQADRERAWLPENPWYKVLMKKTIELLKKQHDVLVDVIVWMDQNKKSNTEIRSKVDIILNHEKKLEEDSEMELTKISYVG